MTDIDQKPTIYRIPEIREPTLFDAVVERVVPEVFRFAEYATLSGFVIFLGNKADNALLRFFGHVLLGCVFFYVMHHWIALIKSLEFRSVWTMRVASALLLVFGLAFVLSAIIVVMLIASTQGTPAG